MPVYLLYRARMGLICSAFVTDKGDRLSSAKIMGPTVIPSFVMYIK
jgi:hypothetical protein